MPRFSRRDFLKLGSAVSGALAVSRLAPGTSRVQPVSPGALPNILVIVFDAMTAKNLSLYGYRRKTTPNLERFAAHATVYHQHYSAGNATTPGTASLLTSLHPWTHRAVNGWGLIARNVTSDNLFRAIGERYYRLAYSQNMFPNYFFGQFQRDIDKILSPASFGLIDQIVAAKFGADLTDSHRAFTDLLFQDHFPPGSLVFGLAENVQLYEAVARGQSDDYPNGLPYTENYPIYFKLKDVFDGLIATIKKLTESSLAYLHIWSPHAPYTPTSQFDKLFMDGWNPKAKPEHVLSDHVSTRHLNLRRQNYDEYVANLDDEFGRLLDALQAKGTFDHSYVIVTSDHGEFFERGVEGHTTQLLYDPVVRVPLLISSPGQTSRQDVHVPTNSVDLVPTLAHLSGAEVPAWCEGQILPGLDAAIAAVPERSLFMMELRNNRALQPLNHGSFAIRKGRHKLIYYMGLPEYDRKDAFELFDIENDPEELNDLYSDSLSIAKDLRAELMAKIKSANAKFRA